MVFLRKAIKKAYKIFRSIIVMIYYQVIPCAYGLNTMDQREQRIIVSLTSYPLRYRTLHLCIKSILRQTCKPDKIFLYLDEGSAEIPKSLEKLKKFGLEICIRPENIKPHKKYYYAMLEHPDDIVITVDDDGIYDTCLIESLMNSYPKYPYAVSCRRAHKMLVDNNGKLLPYNKHEFECKTITEPSMQLRCTNVGGALYPPHCMSAEMFNLDNIKRLCLGADDIWLKFMQVLSNTPVVWVKSRHVHPVIILGTQKITLDKSNGQKNENDLWVKKMEDFYGIQLADYVPK